MKLLPSRRRAGVTFAKARKSALPIAEVLEQRIVPATFIWSAAGGGAWESAANWSISNGTDADGIPDADDDVAINVAASEASITVSSTRSVRSLNMTGDDRLAITTGTFTVS
ncbi:MAG: hypothetical protein EOP84_31735, partial [Verrucomicrobiaceae bacterium]